MGVFYVQFFFFFVVVVAYLKNCPLHIPTIKTNFVFMNDNESCDFSFTFFVVKDPSPYIVLLLYLNTRLAIVFRRTSANLTSFVVTLQYIHKLTV